MVFGNREELESEFSLKLLRFLNAFNYLERNVGLCLSFLLNPEDPRATHNRISKMTAQVKMSTLRHELRRRYSSENKEVLSEFDAWYEGAEKSRALRNKYVHGQWQVLPMNNEKPVAFSLPEWIGGGDHSMSMAEFENAVQEVEGVFEQFIDFRRKHSI